MENSISPLIQASLAPAFLRSAIAATLAVINTRQNRIVDRVRMLERKLTETLQASVDQGDEIEFYLRRAGQVGWSATLCILSALCVAAAVVTLFVDAQIQLSLSVAVEFAFTSAVLFYALSLVLFLRDLLQVNRGLAYVRHRVDSGKGASGRLPE